jgi:hypothetical protein
MGDDEETEAKAEANEPNTGAGFLDVIRNFDWLHIPGAVRAIAHVVTGTGDAASAWLAAQDRAGQARPPAVIAGKITERCSHQPDQGRKTRSARPHPPLERTGPTLLISFRVCRLSLYAALEADRDRCCCGGASNGQSKIG